MGNKQEGRKPPAIRENYAPSHGIHRWSLKTGEVITAISARTWNDFANHPPGLTNEDKIVISPELMTFTGQPLDQVTSLRDEIEMRIDEIKRISARHPETTFVLGSPTFGQAKRPRNSAIFAKSGQILGITNKRSGATPAEKEAFDLPVNEPPTLIPQTQISALICCDLATQSILGRGMEKDEKLLALIGREEFFGFESSLVHPEAKTLVVPSCWGIGGNKELIGKDPDEYYRLQLRNTAWQVLWQNPQIEEIVVVDRTPLVGEELRSITPSRPFNAHFQRVR